jgi:hypothetical protein
MTIILYPLLTVAFYYLLSRAMITRFLWSRYPKWLDYYTLCAACSGFLYGIAVAFAIGWYRDMSFLGLPGRWWGTPLVVGLSSLVWTPVVARWHIQSLLDVSGTDGRADAAEEGDPGA